MDGNRRSDIFSDSDTVFQHCLPIWEPALAPGPQEMTEYRSISFQLSHHFWRSGRKREAMEPPHHRKHARVTTGRRHEIKLEEENQLADAKRNFVRARPPKNKREERKNKKTKKHSKNSKQANTLTSLWKKSKCLLRQWHRCRKTAEQTPYPSQVRHQTASCIPCLMSRIFARRLKGSLATQVCCWITGGGKKNPKKQR